MTVKTIFISIFDGERIEECYEDVDAIIDGCGLDECNLIELTLKYKDGTTQAVSCHSFEIEQDAPTNRIEESNAILDINLE